MKQTILTLGFSCVMFVGCGNPGGSGQATLAELEESPRGYDAPETNWANPIEGVRAPSLAQAESTLPFDARTPKGLGTPSKILLSDPAMVSAKQIVIAYLFDDPELGLVVIKEHLPDVDPSTYVEENRELLKYNGDVNTHGRFSVVSIRGGIEALLTESEDGSEATIFWLEDGIEYIVNGPSLNGQDVVAVAERI
jgi:hypothetical protein